MVESNKKDLGVEGVKKYSVSKFLEAEKHWIVLFDGEE